MPLLGDAVGQSLSTRPDIIGSDISKVQQNTFFFLLCMPVSSFNNIQVFQRI